MTREHGTRARYVFGAEGGDRANGCRCVPCSRANRDFENKRNRQIAYGRWRPYVDAAPSRWHLRALSEAGVGLRRVEALSGVARSTLQGLVAERPDGSPGRTQVRPETEAAILAVTITPAALADSAVTDPTGTRRRVQALVARGWSQARIAARVGMLPGNFSSVLYHRPAVTAATARAVAALYEELQDQAPPEGNQRERIAASRARRYAAERGWAPPAAWDGAIDDPAAKPADGWRRADDRMTSADLAGEGRHLELCGLTRDEAAARLGVALAALSRAMGKHPEAGAA